MGNCTVYVVHCKYSFTIYIRLIDQGQIHHHQVAIKMQHCCLPLKFWPIRGQQKKRLQIQIFGQKKITLVSHFYHKIATFHINYLLSQNHHKFMILCSKDKVTFSSQIYVPHISITKLRFCGIKIFLVLSSFSWNIFCPQSTVPVKSI